ncbi:MAG: tRNA pseudouridine(55) synthase TruB [Deltaproteobacteria bacterium]|jgi:tRNA pseudouridine55 synthase|nr:tRNA pseudouridine(55) synthase TruB [Deltaproteobacteria bacterium]
MTDKLALNADELSGLILIDKAQGSTSHDVVKRLRHLARQKTVGHTGTLDPMATGLMGVLLGQATKLEPYLVKMDKMYYGKARLGLLTDTDDVTGKVLSSYQGAFPTKARIQEVLETFQGPSRQVPPAYSAIKVNGQPAYKAARSGKALKLAPRDVTAFNLSLVEWDEPYLTFTAHVSSGYYIRALVRDLGEKLGLLSGALSELRRLSVGPFNLNQAGPFPTSYEQISSSLIAPRNALAHLPEIELDAVKTERLCSGNFLAPPDDKPAGVYKIIGPQGSLAALAEITAGGCGSGARRQPQRPFLRPLRVFLRASDARSNQGREKPCR